MTDDRRPLPTPASLRLTRHEAELFADLFGVALGELHEMLRAPESAEQRSPERMQAVYLALRQMARILLLSEDGMAWLDLLMLSIADEQVESLLIDLTEPDRP